MRRLANGVDALQRLLHRLALGLRLIRHLLQRLQAARHLVTLATGRRLRRHAAFGQAANLLAGAQRHLARLAHDGLQLGDEAIDRPRHLAHFVLAANIHAARQIALTRRQIVERITEQAQTAEHPPAQHQRHRHQRHGTNHQQAQGDVPAQRVRCGTHRFAAVARHLVGVALGRLQPLAQGPRRLFRRPRQAAVDQLARTVDQPVEAPVECCQLTLDHFQREPHLDLADLRAHRIDFRLDDVHPRITRGGVDQLVQRRTALPRRDQLAHPRVAAVEIARQALALGIVDHREEHRRVLLRDTGQGRQRRDVQIPYSLGRHPGEQPRQRLPGLLETAFEHLAQLRLLALELPGKALGKACAGALRERRQALAHLLLGQVQLIAQAPAFAAQTLGEILDHAIDRRPHQPHRKPDLHQHGQTQGNVHRAQQTTAQHRNDGEHGQHSSTTVIVLTATSGINLAQASFIPGTRIRKDRPEAVFSVIERAIRRTGDAGRWSRCGPGQWR